MITIPHSKRGELSPDDARAALPLVRAWIASDNAYTIAAREPARARCEALLLAAADVAAGIGSLLLSDDIEDARDHVKGERARFLDGLRAASLARDAAKEALHVAGISVNRGDHVDALIDAAHGDADGDAIADFLWAYMDYVSAEERS